MAKIISPVRLDKKKGLRRFFKGDQVQLMILMIPVAIWLLVFCYTPMAGAIVAFKNYKVSKGIFGSDWAGFRNFLFFFKSMDAGRVVRNTLLYNVVFIALNVITGVFVAILLSMIRSKKSLKVFQTTLLFPHFLSWVVIAFMVSIFLDFQNGILNNIITALGGEKIVWYTDPDWWPVILPVVHVWKAIGYQSLIYYAAIINIDSELYEAAVLDGCTTWQTIRHIILPLIRPTIVILTILAVGGIFRGDFGLFYNVTKSSGALLSTTDVIDTYLYRAMFVTGDVGISAAVGLIQSIVGLILVVAVNKIANKVDSDLALF